MRNCLFWDCLLLLACNLQACVSAWVSSLLLDADFAVDYLLEGCDLMQRSSFVSAHLNTAIIVVDLLTRGHLLPWFQRRGLKLLFITRILLNALLLKRRPGLRLPLLLLHRLLHISSHLTHIRPGNLTCIDHTASLSGLGCLLGSTWLYLCPYCFCLFGCTRRFCFF